MLLRRVQTTIIFRDFLALSEGNNLTARSPQEVLDLLQNFAKAAKEEIFIRPTFGAKRFEGAVLRIWELAKKEAIKPMSDVAAWRQVMANCNIVYEEIIFFRDKFAANTSVKRVA